MVATTRTHRGEVRLVLASASPRRRELLGLLGASYETIASDAEERDDPVPDTVLAALPPFDLPRATHPSLLAWRKARHAADLAPDAAILGADTIVVLGDMVLNKPRDPGHACQMLASLSGRTHIVYTGICVIASMTNGREPFVALDLVASEVEVASLSAQVIEDYVATGEPMDKAGSYGIQGLGGQLVRSVRGSYTAVVGLPLVQAHRMLSAAGVVGLHSPEDTYRHWLEQQGKEPLPWPPTRP